MSNLAKLEFQALTVNRGNCMSWQLDAKLHLQAKKLGDTIKEGNTMTVEDKTSALIFLLHCIHDELKNEYLTEEDPLVLWKSLKDRYDHQKAVIYLVAQNEWLNLRFKDFKTMSKYNSTMFNIIVRLTFCGNNVTDAQMNINLLLKHQYQFTNYSELVTCLLVTEENAKVAVLMKNHNSRPSGSMAFLEANVNYCFQRFRGRNTSFRKCGNSIRDGHNDYSRRGSYSNISGYARRHYSRRSGNRKWLKVSAQDYNKTPATDATTSFWDDTCHWCGKHGHWSRVCRAPKAAVENIEPPLKPQRNI